MGMLGSSQQGSLFAINFIVVLAVLRVVLAVVLEQVY